jgi:DNA polymerase-3 subunit gamma/tau
MIVDALAATNVNSILRELPDDQLERMRTQAQNIGAANLSRAADIAAEGLTQMRGATAPRLILELICGRILLPTGDKSDAGLLSRIERLERVDGISTTPVAEKPQVQTKPVVVKEVVEKPVAEKPAAEKPKAKVEKIDGMDVGGLRRMWPDVIENVKKRRRLTWSLLSASAQIIAVDEKALTIGIVNAGARDSFVRSESDEILRQAFIEVVGLDRKIEVVVDPSIDVNATPETRAVQKDERRSDTDLLSGAALLAAELGAQVISEKAHE